MTSPAIFEELTRNQAASLPSFKRFLEAFLSDINTGNVAFDANERPSRGDPGFSSHGTEYRGNIDPLDALKAPPVQFSLDRTYTLNLHAPISRREKVAYTLRVSNGERTTEVTCSRYLGEKRAWQGTNADLVRLTKIEEALKKSAKKCSE